MNAIDNSKISSEDISLGLLLDTLAGAKDLPLVFHYDGRPVKAGYHVTEVKAGHFSALDCGANPEAWSEIFVQLWDIDEDGRTHMPGGKFSAIIRKVSACEAGRIREANIRGQRRRAAYVAVLRSRADAS